MKPNRISEVTKSSIGAISASVGILNSFAASLSRNIPASAFNSSPVTCDTCFGSCTNSKINKPEKMDRPPITNMAQRQPSGLPPNWPSSGVSTMPMAEEMPRTVPNALPRSLLW